MARVQFALKMALAHLKRERKHCPYCDSCMHFRLQRKWVVVEARQCAFCGLIFRYPTDDPSDSTTFYEFDYAERQVSDLPDFETLRNLIASDFAQSEFDKSCRVDFLKSLRTAGKVLDFGCSWGYGLHQLRKAGFEGIGFELAQGMANYGREQLGLDIRTDWKSLGEDQVFDLIYTEHVLEHMPNLRQPLEGFSRLIKPGGLLVIFVPNAGGLIGRQLGVRWKAFIGEAHTIAFTPEWFTQNLPRHGFLIETLSSALGQRETLFDGEEIACIARKIEGTSNGSNQIQLRSP